MRTFQLSDAKSHKFWTIDLQGSGFTVTYGKVGTAGQTNTKTFATPEKARAEAEKLVREKTAKGYVETTPQAAATEAEALERGILADPHDAAAWGVYADYLVERGDPRGEFMLTQIALEDEALSKAERDRLRRKEAALLSAHRAEWLGPLAEPEEAGKEGPFAPTVVLEFSRGWLSKAGFRRLTVNQARALRGAEARFLRELTVDEAESETAVGVPQQYIDSHYEPGPDVPADVDAYDGPALHALCRCPHLGGVRVFRLGESMITADGTEDPYPNCHTPGQLAYHLVKQMPNLEELYLLAHRVEAAKIFPLPMPNLRVLQLFHSDSYPLDRLAANPSLTRLETLRCHPHALEDSEEGGAYIRLTHLRALCRSPHLTGLRHLCLRLADFGDAGVKEIVESGALKRLRVLDLRSGCVTDAGAKLLAACPDLKDLEFLDLASNALTDDRHSALNATGVRFDASRQHGAASGLVDGYPAEFLYEGDIE